MQRLIVKTAVKTVLILLGIIIAAFAIFNFAFPQHMATAMETLGNYGMAVKYANLRYVYTGDCFDLARCYDDSVLSEDDESIVYYAEKLIADADYGRICSSRNELYNGTYSEQFGFNFDYDLRVRSTLSVSYYNIADEHIGEEREECVRSAVNFAFQANGKEHFPFGNALMTLSYKISNKNDAFAAAEMLSVLEQVSGADSEESTNLEYVKGKLRGVG